MGEIVELPVNRVMVMQNLLPRFITGTDEEVVARYCELMADGVEFPPIKVWKDGKENWLVLDGAHRLEAAERAKKEKIKCELEEFPEEEFLLRAFAENLRHGLPLKREEKVLVVQALFQQGISLTKISKITGIPERTLRRWLKPLRKKQREELREKVWELKSQGLTQEEIAKEVGRTHQDVSWILQKTAKWPNFAETEAELKENTNNTLEPIGISVKADKLPKKLKEVIKAASGPEPKETPPAILPEENLFLEEDLEHYPEKEETDWDNPVEEATEKSSPPEEIEEEPPCGVTEVREFFPQIVTLDRVPLIRAIELIDYNWPVKKIVKYLESRYPEVKPTEKWVRNLAAIALMAWWKEREKDAEPDEVIASHLENLKVEQARFKFIFWYKVRFKQEFTQREVLLRWLEQNHSGYHDEIIQVIREEKMIRYYLAKGINPWNPDEREKPRPIPALPRSIEEKFMEMEEFFYQLTEDAQQGVFREKVARNLRENLNSLITRQNEFSDALSKWETYIA